MQSGAIFIYSDNEEDKRERERERVSEREGGREERLVAIWKEVTSGLTSLRGHFNAFASGLTQQRRERDPRILSAASRNLALKLSTEGQSISSEMCVRARLQPEDAFSNIEAHFFLLNI